MREKMLILLPVLILGFMLFSCARETVPEVAPENPQKIVNGKTSSPVAVKKDEDFTASSVYKGLKSAAAAKKFLFVLFFEKDDEPTAKMKAVFKEAEKKYGKDKADFLVVKVNDQPELGAVKKYEIDRVNKPVMLVLSADGTVINGFIEEVSPAQIEESFISDKMVSLLKAIQEQKPVFICFLSKDGTGDKDMLKEVEDYASGVKDGVVIKVSPQDKADKPFYKRFDMDPEKSEAAVTIMDRGALLGTVKGEVTRKKIDAIFNCDCSSG